MVLLWQIIMPWLKWVSRESGHERVLHALHAHYKPETYASSYQVTVTCTQPVRFFTVRALSRVLNHTKSEKRSVSFVSRSRTMSPPKEIWTFQNKTVRVILKSLNTTLYSTFLVDWNENLASGKKALRKKLWRKKRNGTTWLQKVALPSLRNL